MASIDKDRVLQYHKLNDKPGKLSIQPTKPLETQLDLGLAYTPGVAYPVLEIERDPALAYEYTSKGNLVAVITNGTAILGLGHRGALASKPVMEGKAVLFKKFADIDSIDIEIDSTDPETVIAVIAAIGKSFGGINLEDIRSPECFYIEERLKAMLDIPVFHDDQHGTAIILGAALTNALESPLSTSRTSKWSFQAQGLPRWLQPATWYGWVCRAKTSGCAISRGWFTVAGRRRCSLRRNCLPREKTPRHFLM